MNVRGEVHVYLAPEDCRRLRLEALARGVSPRAHPPEAHARIVLFRPPAAGRGTTLLFVRRHLAALFERDLTGGLLGSRSTGYASGRNDVAGLRRPHPLALLEWPAGARATCL
jgi:hypothetical protein